MVKAEIIDIGPRRELFIDEYLIERMSGAARLRLHQPVETDDVFVHDTPWEGNRTLYYTIFQDGDLYRMYYRGSQIDLGSRESQFKLRYRRILHSVQRDLLCRKQRRYPVDAPGTQYG